MAHVSIIGTGNMGQAVAAVAGRGGHTVSLLGTLLAAFALAWGIAAAVTHASTGSRSADDMH